MVAIMLAELSEACEMASKISRARAIDYSRKRAIAHPQADMVDPETGERPRLFRTRDFVNLNKHPISTAARMAISAQVESRTGQAGTHPTLQIMHGVYLAPPSTITVLPWLEGGTAAGESLPP